MAVIYTEIVRSMTAAHVGKGNYLRNYFEVDGVSVVLVTGGHLGMSCGKARLLCVDQFANMCPIATER
jgi:hypothetical protein